MAFAVTTVAPTQGTPTGSTLTVTLRGSWTGGQTSPIGSQEFWHEWGYSNYANSTPSGDSMGTSGSYSRGQTMDSDRTARCRAKGQNLVASDTGANLVFKTNAQALVLNTPTIDDVGPCHITIRCTWKAMTNESSANLSLQYKKASESDWTVAGSAGASGTSLQTTVRTATGLEPGILYNIRAVMTRDTNNNTTDTSATVNQSTTDLDLTTDAASAVADTTATLNATVNPSGAAVVVYFEYGPDTSYGTTTAEQNPGTGSSPVPVTQGLTGLAQNSTYHYRAVVESASGCSVYGDDVEFTTTSGGGGGGGGGGQMPAIFREFHRYGLAKNVYFALVEPAATGDDRFITTASPFVAGDVKLSKDGGAMANVTTLPTQITASQPLYQWAATAAEMAALQWQLSIKDQDGPAFRDAMIVSELTKEELLLIGTAQAGGASSVTLPAAASSVDDFYNEHQMVIIGGTGIGQSRNVIDYVGSTRVATANRAWSTTPDATSVIAVIRGADVWYQVEGTEPATGRATTATRTPMFMIGKTWRRFLNKITQSATVHTIMKDDATTTDVSGSVSNDGSTVTKGHLS